MYLPLIKLSLVFEFFRNWVLQNFMSLFTFHEPRDRREQALTKVEV